MPWGPADASRFTKLADNYTRAKLWAETANRVERSTGDKGQAIRLANAAVSSQVRGRPRRAADRRQAAAQASRLL